MRRVIEIAGYLSEYGQRAHQQGLSFLLETAASDMAQLIQDADQLIRAEFLGMGVRVRREQVVVAVPAAVVAAPGQFDRARALARRR